MVGQNRFKALVMPLVGAALLVLAGLVLHHELRLVHYAQILSYLKVLPSWRLLLAVLFTFSSFLALGVNEALTFRAIGRPQPLLRALPTAFVSHAISHSVGYSLISGGGLRLWFYSAWGLSTLDVSVMMAQVSIFFWLGFFLLAGVAFVADPLPLPAVLHLPVPTVLPVGVVFLLLVGLFLLLSLRRSRLRLKGWELQPPPPRLTLAMIAISAVDWLVSFLALYVMLPVFPGRSAAVVLAVFLLAQIVGAGSQVPGGLGVFESVFLVLLAPGARAPAVVGALVAFRAVYYLLPLLLSTLALGMQQALARSEHLKVISRLVARWVEKLLPPLFSFMTLVSGAILLFSGATPTVGARLGWLRRFLPLSVLELSHFLNSLAGILLIFLARGLQRRLAIAYRLTLPLLAAGIVFSLVKGFDYEEALVLAVVLLAMRRNRQHFNRRAALTAEPFTPSWIAAITIVLSAVAWLTFFSYKHVEYSRELWWLFTFDGDAPRSLRALAGASALAFLIALWRLMRPARPPRIAVSEADLRRVAPLVAAESGTMAHLALLGDKDLLFSRSGRSFLMYAAVGRSWVAMGDPLGDPAEAGELIWDFRERSHRNEGRTVFYEVSKRYLHHYIDLGLTLLKLGEEARVPLAGFSLEGKANKWLRHVSRRLEQEDCRFEIVPPEAVLPLLPELRGVSDHWLQHKRTREKGFSLGFFSEGYLCLLPLALVRRQDRIVAFANLWIGADRQELSVDLMRFLPDGPDNMMDFLFVQLMLWGRDRGYAWFNLGMAPFSGLTSQHLAPLWQRFGAFLFRHGENFYNFQGLRRFKEKFNPVWEPRYLASPGGIALPRVLADVSALVSRGLKGVVSK
jgi:phosphatidylglycerol lysyltransferase